MSKVKNTDFGKGLVGFEYKGNEWTRDNGSTSTYENGEDSLTISYDKYFDEVYVVYWKGNGKELPVSFSETGASEKIEEVREKIQTLIKG